MQHYNLILLHFVITATFFFEIRALSLLKSNQHILSVHAWLLLLFVASYCIGLHVIKGWVIYLFIKQYNCRLWVWINSPAIWQFCILNMFIQGPDLLIMFLIKFLMADSMRLNVPSSARWFPSGHSCEFFWVISNSCQPGIT